MVGSDGIGGTAVRRAAVAVRLQGFDAGGRTVGEAVRGLCMLRLKSILGVAAAGVRWQIAGWTDRRFVIPPLGYVAPDWDLLPGAVRHLRREAVWQQWCGTNWSRLHRHHEIMHDIVIAHVRAHGFKLSSV